MPLLFALAGAILAVPAAATPGPAPQARAAWIVPNQIRFRELGRHGISVIHLPSRGRPADWRSRLQWFPDGRRIAELRADAESKPSELFVVDTRNGRSRRFRLPQGRFVELAVSADGRQIALAAMPRECLATRVDDLAVYVVEVATGSVVRLRLPSHPFPSVPNAHFWVDELSWSPRGDVSFLFGRVRGDCESANGGVSALIVSRPQRTARLRVVVRISGAFQTAYAWARDGRRIAYVISDPHRDTTVVHVVTARGKRVANVRAGIAANIVDVDWLQATPILYINDDSLVSIYRLDLRRRRRVLMLKPGGIPGGIAAVSTSGRFVGLEPYGRNAYSVIDVRTRRNLLLWVQIRDGADLFLR